MSLRNSLRRALGLKAYTVLIGIYHTFKRYSFSVKKFGHIESTCQIDLPIKITHPNNVFLYDNTHIGADSTIFCSNAKFVMKKGSGSAGNLTIVTGNHERIIGRFYRTITESEKSSEMDKDVVIEEDVWIGLNVTILSGCTVGRGCNVAAGAIITKSMPPYAVVGGIPAKVLKFYWTIDQILEHERTLYPENERYTRSQLEAFRNVIGNS